jgi:O-antigen/teichoic acid export membrane protein
MAKSEKSLVKRFLHLASAQAVEGILGGLLLLYLSWLDSVVFGQVMYALFAAGIVTKVIHFGLYYPLVSQLAEAEPENAPEILNRVNVIKLLLLFPCMLSLVGLSLFQGFSAQMSLVLFSICLGHALEQIAETFFADFRVRGLQPLEGRIKVIAAVASNGYGFAAVFFGLNPVLISCFKLLSGIVRILLGVAVYLKDYGGGLLRRPKWAAVWAMFAAAVSFALYDILGVVYNVTNVFFLEHYSGVKDVAYYSATYNLVNPVSTLCSEQALGWVLFPFLAVLWWENRDKAAAVVRSNALWLMAVAFPIMFFLHAESPFIIGLIYPAEYKEAIRMQQYLVWSILLAFETNLFSYVMMIAGSIRLLLIFSIVTSIVNLGLNAALVPTYGPAGACLVYVFSKLVMTVLTFGYCRIAFRFVRLRAFLFPIGLAAISVGLFILIKPLMTLHPAVVMTLATYGVGMAALGTKFLGPIYTKDELS